MLTPEPTAHIEDHYDQEASRAFEAKTLPCPASRASTVIHTVSLGDIDMLYILANGGTIQEAANIRGLPIKKARERITRALASIEKAASYGPDFMSIRLDA